MVTRTRSAWISAILALAAATLAHAATTTVTITDLGAVSDGKTLTSPAIQKAIDDVSAKGGGTVVVPAGDFVVGTLLLKDNVTLKLEDGARLLGSDNLADYQNVDPFKDGL